MQRGWRGAGAGRAVRKNTSQKLYRCWKGPNHAISVGSISQAEPCVLRRTQSGKKPAQNKDRSRLSIQRPSHGDDEKRQLSEPGIDRPTSSQIGAVKPSSSSPRSRAGWFASPPSVLPIRLVDTCLFPVEGEEFTHGCDKKIRLVPSGLSIIGGPVESGR